MKFKYLPTFIAIAVVLAALFLFTSWKADHNNFEEEKTTVVMRKIGHEILLLSGDSTSRVMPVKQFNKGEYQIRFESPFAFVPDSLLKTIQQIISHYQLPSDYIVNVIDCSSKEIIFGSAILESEKNNVIACVGRQQPKGCYFINLMFKTNTPFTLQKNILAGIAILLAAGVLFFALKWNSKRKKPAIIQEAAPATTREETAVSIGKYSFLKNEQCLVLDDERIELSLKEAELLLIFANNPNQIIDRNRLQKEVWEDKGVIVGRSLDMFISKLRKKLEKDDAVKLVNVHSKGYKLEIG